MMPCGSWPACCIICIGICIICIGTWPICCSICNGSWPDDAPDVAAADVPLDVDGVASAELPGEPDEAADDPPPPVPDTNCPNCPPDPGAAPLPVFSGWKAASKSETRFVMVSA